MKFLCSISALIVIFTISSCAKNDPTDKSVKNKTEVQQILNANKESLSAYKRGLVISKSYECTSYNYESANRIAEPYAYKVTDIILSVEGASALLLS